MYGETLPNTGATTLTILGVSVSSFWLSMALVTAGGVLLAVGRIIPRKEV